MMYISIHIPKTAGTTIGYLLDYGFRRRIFYDYSESERDGQLLEEDVRLVNSHKLFIEKKFDVIHGHFHYKKYSTIFPDAKYLVCLREPVRRTLSQYFHVIEEGEGAHWSYSKLISGEMDLVDFASLPYVKRAQSAHIEGRNLNQFDHIFLSEKLTESVYKFQLNHDFTRNDPYMGLEGNASIPNTNPRNARKQIRKDFSKSMLDEVKKVLIEDMELYKQGVMLFEKQ